MTIVTRQSAPNRMTGPEIESELDPAGVRILNYWRRLGEGHDGPPPKARFDPLDVPQALPGMMVVEKRLEDDELYYRLVGTREVAERGFDPTGMLVKDGFFGHSWELIEAHYHAVMRGGEPILALDDVRKRNFVTVRDVALFLPMSDQQGAVRFVMVYGYQRPVSEDQAG